MSRRFLLIDRDGTLIEEKNYLCDPDGVELIPGAVECLGRFQAAGWGIAVVTNQAGIGRGYYGLPELNAVNERISQLLARQGVSIDTFYACPHHPEEDCRCRKPNPGMVEQAVADHAFDPAYAIVAGDKACDIELAKRVGATSVLVRTGYGREEEKRTDLHPDFIIDSLADLADRIGLPGESPGSAKIQWEEL